MARECMFEDEVAGGDVVANNAGNGAVSVPGIADGRTGELSFGVALPA
jgi:hypothetical protein